MAEVLFEQFRLSLRVREQLGLFSEYDSTTRDEWIRILFSMDVEFMHYGSLYHYVPKPAEESSKLVIGRLGRKTYTQRNTTPETGLEDYIDETWRASVVVVDPSEHSDGQKVAMQRLSDVGSPISLLPRLLVALEEAIESETPFLTSINPIANQQAFRDWVTKNKGKVTRVSFFLDVPNMYSADDEFDKEMKEFRDLEKAQKVKIEVSSPDGIDTGSKRITYTAEKAMERGTGKVTAKAMGKNNTFSSHKKQKKVKIQIDDEGNETPLVDRVEAHSNRIFGRDED